MRTLDHNCSLLGALNYSSEKETSTTGRTTPKLQPPKRDQSGGTTAVGRGGNRFGFRQNVVRPTTSGITPKFNEFDSENNNNSTAPVPASRRSKSATASARSTFLNDHNKQQQQQHQFVYQHNDQSIVANNDLHTNAVTPPAAT